MDAPRKQLLVKLSHLKDPYLKPEDYKYGAAVPNGEKFIGHALEAPQVGRACVFAIPDPLDPNHCEVLRTSKIMSVYEVDEKSSFDKLVLPSDFPEPLKLDIPELQQKDILFATMNSLYLLRPLEN
jgi:hypothetical protein